MRKQVRTISFIFSIGINKSLTDFQILIEGLRKTIFPSNRIAMDKDVLAVTAKKLRELLADIDKDLSTPRRNENKFLKKGNLFKSKLIELCISSLLETNMLLIEKTNEFGIF
jgi:hypothetical protein